MVNNKKQKRNRSVQKTETQPIPEQQEIKFSLPKSFGNSYPNSPYLKQLEQYNKPKIFVATPCYIGNVHVKYMESIMGLQSICIQKGIGFEFFNIPFDSLIPRARNACVTRFMQSEDCTHLLFIDADIQFHPSSVLKLLVENKDVISGCYPKKAIDFEAVKDNYSKTDNQIELIQSSVKYAFNFKPQKKSQVRKWSYRSFRCTYWFYDD